jgi:hypothetical protein
MRLQEPTGPPTSGVIQALGDLASLEQALLDFRADTSMRRALSRPARRRIEAAGREAEENLVDIRCVLLMLAGERVSNPWECRHQITRLACETVGAWRFSTTESAAARQSGAEHDALAEFLRVMEDALRDLVDTLTPKDERQLEAANGLLARPDHPVM